MTITLDTTALDELSTNQAKKLHDLMSQLRSCGISSIVELPQIIVVGQQNAGKSSVLEAISGVRFPVTAGLCTRFATEISFHKTESSRVNVQIRRDNDSGGANTKDGEIDKAFDESGAAKDDLPELIQKAKEHMGIFDGGKDFSKDVLCVKVEGPDMVPLTLVDLPGIYVNETATQTKEGIKTVEELVNRYMAQPKTIMLVIVEANTEVVNHVALAKAREHDPKHERTLGVVTKPDLAKSQAHIEAAHVRLVQNREPTHDLKLGWHVLRNASEDGESSHERDAVEAKFLASPPWNAVDEADRGIAKLREKLSRFLYNHTSGCLHTLIEDIEKNLQKRRQEKENLGSERPEHKDKRAFLLTIAAEFQRLLRDADGGHYVDDFFGSLTSPRNRLRAELRGFHRALAFVLRTKGHTLSIARTSGDGGALKNESSAELDSVPRGMANFLDLHPYDFPLPKSVPRSELKRQLEVLALASEGRELPGSGGSELALHLFRVQAAPWMDIARLHIKSVAAATKSFVEQLIHHVLAGRNAHLTEELLLRDYVDKYFAERDEMLGMKLTELLVPYVKGYAVPLEDEFERLVSRWRVERLARQLQDLTLSGPATNDAKAREKDDKVRLLLAAVDMELSPDGAFDRTEDVIDMMQAYYEMSLRTFTDNITNLAIEGCLIHDLATMFTPVHVGNMSDKRLEELAAEPAAAKSRRAQLVTEIATLQEGLDMCRRWLPRADQHSTPTKRESGIWFTPDLPAEKTAERGKESPSTPKSAAAGLSGESRPALTPFSQSPASRVASGTAAKQPAGTSPFGFGDRGSSAVDSAFGSEASSNETPGKRDGVFQRKNL
ncbi:hypothetical protein PWT90_11095 [Aphanocladium album]|nr:hypothetical protein PWT90_11095 [Aphanocladium album]